MSISAVVVLSVADVLIVLVCIRLRLLQLAFFAFLVRLRHQRRRRQWSFEDVVGWLRCTASFPAVGVSFSVSKHPPWLCAYLMLLALAVDAA